MPSEKPDLLYRRNKLHGIRFLLFFIALISACIPGDPTNKESGSFDLSVRMGQEPDRINPILSRQSQSSQIEQKIFLPLCEYQPTTLEFQPILLDSLPKVTSIADGPLRGGLRYDFQILPDAVWSDGVPITGYDFEFTMKAALDPYLVNLSWKSHLSHIEEIIVDDSNSKHVTVLTKDRYILSEEVITNNSIYPAHFYDSTEILKPFSFAEVKGASDGATVLDNALREFAEKFNSEEYSRSSILGSGPYEFVEWIPNQQIIISRKKGWWGSKYQGSSPLLEAFPSKITYYFIADAQTAITALKDQRIDVISDLTPEQFQSLKAHNQTSNSLQLETPPILQYYYIAYNNSNKILEDVAVRNAISHLMDTKTLIEELFFGLATPTIGPIHPSNPAYNHALNPIKFDPLVAMALLDEAGWKDTDNDQVLDKVLNGTRQALKLSILTSKMQLSQDVAVILKEEAMKLGIALEIEAHETRNLIQLVRTGAYDMACLASIQSVGPFDPYSTWHSDNTGSNGQNICKFSSEACDQIIEEIRTTINHEDRTRLYAEFQEIIYAEQPALFLVAPKTTIACNNRFTFVPSVMRPGYFENAFMLREL